MLIEAETILTGEKLLRNARIFKINIIDFSIASSQLSGLTKTMISFKSKTFRFKLKD